MDDWASEDWRAWAEATKPGTYLLEKGERVVAPPPSTPEEKARFLSLMKALREKHGAKANG